MVGNQTATVISALERPARIAETREALALLHGRGFVFEVRALDVPMGRNYRGTIAGYYDDLEKAALHVQECDDRGAAGVFTTLNPCMPALLGRSANHLTEKPKHTTGDSEVSCRRWLYVDIDPHRPAGIAANQAERQAALELASEIEDVLRSRGWSYPLLVDSGNGVHLLYRVDLPNSDEATSLLKRFYSGLQTLIGDNGGAHIDAVVYNPSRIVRIGGTTNRKGDNTSDRPHRRCAYLQPSPDQPVELIPEELIRAVADLAPQPTARSSATPHPNGNGRHAGPHAAPHVGPRLDVERWLTDRNIRFRTKGISGGTAYLVPCPFGNHGGNGESAVMQADSGLLTFECKHSSCQGRRWADYRDAIGKPGEGHYEPPIATSGKNAVPPSDRETPAGDVAYRAVEPGTIVKATDKGENYGDVVSDNGSSCTVHFCSPEGNQATVEIDKTHLFLQDGTPLAIGPKAKWTKAPSIGELVKRHPKLRRPIIHKLLRVGETVNIIAPPKRGKSWLAIILAISIVLGRKFVDVYDTEPGRVLILDNELHGETTADRVPKVAEALGIPFSEIEDRLFVENFRGKLVDVYGLGEYFDQYEPGEWSAVVCDALYRFLPEGVDENNNSQMTGVYNQIDHYAMKLDCGFACVHHASKGNQSGKAVTDVGAGAGSQARAVDTHLILRDHAEPDCVVLEAAARSWPPVEPIVLRWQWPLWQLADELDPKLLKPDRPTAQDKLETIKADILKAFVHFPDGATKTAIQQYTGRPSAWERAMRELLDDGVVATCEVSSKSHRKPDAGFRRVYAD